MHVHARAAVLLAFVSTLAACAGGAPPSSPTPNGDDDETKTIAEATESSRRIDGLFTLFQDTVTGETHMLVRPDQVDREFIYFAHTVDGVVDAGQLFNVFFHETSHWQVHESHAHADNEVTSFCLRRSEPLRSR